MTRKDKIDMLGKVLSGDKKAISQLKARSKRIDFSKLSDEELNAIIAHGPKLSPEEQAYWDSFTDEELHIMIETGEIPKKQPSR
ncbi:hypothetical protein BWI93_04530 [Siphonobacter sp. BAB-5385]|uniref:hypothetical protein n=1 Tax=Siphonobacter sp. BAB-5385 TaxID=1864822 RepID=UPI000B9EBC3A|nr:hypothetical protein [Siphonobacter sp. BAB-5385]OZI09330.1 hypothetical protein BWI93_04530 [Siphonobacter sp. BAB-5385]